MGLEVEGVVLRVRWEEGVQCVNGCVFLECWCIRSLVLSF